MSDEIDRLALANQICFAAYSASHAFARRYKPLLAVLGVTYPQYLCLLVLWEQDGLSVKEIGRRLLLDSGTLTPLLKRLEAMGLLVRRRDRDDERVVRISLTERGRALRATAETIPPALMQATGCSVAELGVLRDGLLALRDNLLAEVEDEAG